MNLCRKNHDVFVQVRDHHDHHLQLRRDEYGRAPAPRRQDGPGKKIGNNTIIAIIVTNVIFVVIIVTVIIVNIIIIVTETRRS